jgi:hypothetical protein
MVPLTYAQPATLAQQQPQFVENTNITIYYQRSTSNTSFIEMSNYLKAIGVQNNRFMLALLDKDLAGIDPHDPNLPTLYRMKVLKEVRNNFWYYLREVVRIPTSGPPSPFILNRGNMAFLYMAIMNINTILLLPRQTGKTIGASCFYTYVYNFRTQNTQISLLNKEFKDSKENLGRIRAIRDLLPSYLRFDAVFSVVNGKKTKVPNTAIYMEQAVNHNKLRTYAKARNELAAATLLRGQTFPLLWADEFAFIPFMRTIYGNMSPAMSKAVEIAKQNNVPYGILYTTTPGFLTTEEGKYAYRIINNATKFNEGWYDLSYYQLIDLINSNKLSTFVYIQFTYQELGYSEEWFYDQCKKQDWDWPLIRREFLLEWSDESENNPFTKEELDTVKKFCKNPKKTFLIFGKYELRIFEEIPLRTNLVPKYPPIIGVDPSGGVSKDSSCLTFVDSRTTRVFAELRCNTMSLIDLARVIEYIVRNMMPNAIINIERNGGYGLSVIGKLKETPVKRNLYYEIKDRILEETVDHGQIVRKMRKTKVYGTNSNKEVRDQLIDLLTERMRHHKDKFISPTIYNELRGLEVKKNGKVEHSDLTHDDQIFSFLMAMYVWYEGKNLRENFGIEKFGIKTEESIDDIVDLAGAEDFGDITKQIGYATRDDQDKFEAQLADMEKAKGMMLGEYVEQQRKAESERLHIMLQNPAIKQAYANKYGVPVDSVTADEDDVSGGLGGQDKIPDSLFTDFNKDESQWGKDSVYFTLNPNNLVQGRHDSMDENESLQ